MPAAMTNARKGSRAASNRTATAATARPVLQSPAVAETSPTASGCACGGGCPRCQAGNSGVQRVLTSAGRPLSSEVRTELEADFQHDFSAVRVHDDAQADASAREIGARAYTAGSHIAFARGTLAPDREDGRRLLRHELTHVIQQEQAGTTPDARTEISILPRDHATEAEARQSSLSPRAPSARLPAGRWLQRADGPDAGAPVTPTPDAGTQPKAPDAGQTQDGGVKGDQNDAGQLDDSSTEKLDLSARGTTAGMLERLFMAEARTPLQESSYDETDSLQCMRATGACIINRKNDAKKRWPKTIDDVVKQKGQFKGFDTYPEYGEDQRQHNIEVLKWANQKSKFQAACRTFVKNAKKVAADTEAEKVTDPFKKDGGTFGMRTAGSSSPGGGFKKVGSFGGNDFYTVT